MGIRRARYDGLHKTHLQHILTSVAINLVRIDAFLTDTPLQKAGIANVVQVKGAIFKIYFAAGDSNLNSIPIRK